MTAKDPIRQLLHSTQNLLNMHLEDLSDADLLVRPVPAANHIAWQLGHVISSEQRLASALPGGVYPELPAGFPEQHAKERAAVEPPKGFLTKAEYLKLFHQTRAATLATLEKMDEADLDKPSSVMPQFAPNLGALFVLVGNHTMMHVGQFTTTRRKLGKPVLF